MKKKLLSFWVLTLMMAVLTGCFGGSNGGKTDADSAENEKNIVKLNVAYMPNYGSLWSIVTAVEKGYMAEEGIEVNLIEFADGPTIVTGMESGSVDLGYIGQGAHKFCINGQVEIFALSHISNADMLIGGPDIQKVEDLRGRKVAYASGTSSEDILINSLKRAGMTMDDIIAVDMDKKGIISAMTSGGVDAAAIWSPHNLKILTEVNGSTKLTDNMTFSDETVSLSSWIVTSEFAQANREVLVRFTRALFKAMDDAAEKNQEETAALVATQIGEEKEVVYEQRGDAQWFTGKEVANGAQDGTVEGYYKLQKQAFIDAGAVEHDTDVKEYVMFDIMIEAGQY